ncbi:M14 family metallopeptidase [Cecembia sp.]|uniref:M14 family metallopeptidase n=1 Tax=Cecembia sp. TaxID=1898110 RepID=UPI0025BCA461|nr:M14 family metallopeptidase [Cecembia sp.]
MKNLALTLILFSVFAFASSAQNSPKGTANIELEYYLPDGFTYDANIPKPKEVLGFEVGEWNVDYEQLVRYFEKLAATSPRVSFEVFGFSYEKRPQVLLTITHPDNLQKIDQIRAERQNLKDSNANLNYEEMPLVLQAGYSVHGNEASGINSSLLAAYHFTAANEIADDLKNMVILIDPSLNPDGYSRYSTWVNAHRSYNLNGDPNTRELSEAWPGGRGNHYWFDLNRDWLLVQHPESQNRVKKFQEWLPNIYLDYHEMGTNSTFFFPPGIPSRDHPLIPKKTVELTEKIAQYHAKGMEEIGSLYYAKESFDEYYFGYGSTYPDIQGSIGILFEQASSRGHLQESNYGPLTFAFTIRNQFRMSISSFNAAKDMRAEINKSMHDFYKTAIQQANADTDKAFIFGSQTDGAKSFHLADMIRQHAIDVFSLNEDITVNGVPFSKGNSYIIPLNQPQYRLVKAFFETRNEFQDSLFYDVSAWTMPMAFNLDFAALSSRILNLADVSPLQEDFSMPAGELKGEKAAYSYGFGWEGYYAPKAAYQLMKEGYLVRVTHEPITLADKTVLQRGSILVSMPRDPKDKKDEDLDRELEKIAKETGLTIHAISSGYTGGINLGSPQTEVLKKPEMAILVSTGVVSLEAGEIWHLMDQRMDVPITLLPTERLATADLSRYNVISMPNGPYNKLGKEEAEKIKSWTSAGGTLIARGSALEWLNKQELVKFEFKEEEDKEESKPAQPYSDFIKNTGARRTSGTIFHASLDISHPVGYGFEKGEIFTFRNNNLFLEKAKNAYANPMVYTENPLASGYVHPENVEKIKNTAIIQVKRLGGGRVIALVDNPNFRATWFGTNKLFLNAVFFGQTIKPDTAD